jgi:prepilin-type N-terminal cleavage/methylation domain-containing protein
MKRQGFSLLEVILALAILGGAIAVLGELARQGLENTRLARDTACAQLLCESKLAELLSGMEYPEPVQQAPLTSGDVPSQFPWVYSIELVPTAQDGLVAVWVTVTQELPSERHPAQCTLVRWILDPGVALSEAQTEGSTGFSSGGLSSP